MQPLPCSAWLPFPPLGCLLGWMSFFLKLSSLLFTGQFAFYYFLHTLQSFLMHLSFLSGVPLPSVQHHPHGSILVALLQLISKRFSDSLPVSEVWTTWRLSAGPLIYCLRPFHYLSLHTEAAPVLSSDLCTFIQPCHRSGLWLHFIFPPFVFIYLYILKIIFPCG